MNNGTAPPPQGKSETCLWPSIDGCAISYFRTMHPHIVSSYLYSKICDDLIDLLFQCFFPANYAGNRGTVTEAYFRLSPIVSRRGLTILEREGGRENDRDREEGGRREREKGFRVRDKNSPRSSMTIAFYSSTVPAAWFGETRTE